MSTSHWARRARAIAVVLSAQVFALESCIPAQSRLGGYYRPPQIVGEWIDVAKSSTADSSIWVLRRDGYDGIMHIRIVLDSLGAQRVVRDQARYGSWYASGTLGDTTRQTLCVSRRTGRFGASCVAFSLDTTRDESGVVRRLRLRGYRGQHHTSDRLLIARAPGP